MGCTSHVEVLRSPRRTTDAHGHPCPDQSSGTAFLKAILGNQSGQIAAAPDGDEPPWRAIEHIDTATIFRARQMDSTQVNAARSVRATQ
jgi:hypothetical protein